MYFFHADLKNDNKIIVKKKKQPYKNNINSIQQPQ